MIENMYFKVLNTDIEIIYRKLAPETAQYYRHCGISRVIIRNGVG